MQRNEEHLASALIDLGSVTDETKGRFVGLDDHEGGLEIIAGISDE
ncbi:benenodin family lasso peptide [Sphingopyxis alaskensis]|jgi:hypothetical protein|nr:benenodin family lasso peptide [Sphingopyxis alaskensis]MCM3420955.1 benenodin family lasso peptide [Sphingopyxis alaskensis]